MADRLWRAQVTVPLDGLLPEDYIVNTWHFDDDDDPIAVEDDTRDWVMDMLTTFYQSIDGVIFPAQVLSPLTVKLFDMTDAVPRQPLYIEEIPVTPTLDNMLPAEVAICLSFKGQLVSGQNPAHRRGRVYLGPIAETAQSFSGSQSRPGSIVRDAIRDAAAVMQQGIEHPASPGFRARWSIYSPTWHLGRDATPANPDTGWPGSPAIPPHAIGEAFNDVLTGWVDDSFDTQRRRGPKATVRDTF